MAVLPISQELADKLSEVARQQNCPFENLLEAWLAQVATGADARDS